MTIKELFAPSDMTVGKPWEKIVAFTIPMLIGNIAQQLYNTVDSIVIGKYVGDNALAAVGSASPILNLLLVLFVGISVGAGVMVSQYFGARQRKELSMTIGNCVTLTAISSIIIMILGAVLSRPLLEMLKTPDSIIDWCTSYLVILMVGCAGSAYYNILCGILRGLGDSISALIYLLVATVINIVLDAVFVLGFHWGMYGAAAATVIGQVISAIIAVCYLSHYRTVTLHSGHFRPNASHLAQICSLGMASAINQVAMMIVQITMNNLLKHYGAQSVYGESIPIACSGIVMKVNQLYFSVIIGLSQGSQPIQSFNYGAKQYNRVKESYRLAITVGAIVSIVSFLLFQIFPRQILGLFGSGSKEYFDFGVNYFRIFLLFTWLNFMQPISSTFFSSIGKAYKGTFLSLTRQILFLLPLLLLFPRFWGIKGILYASPVADVLSFAVGLAMVIHEFQLIRKLEVSEQNTTTF